METSPKIVRFSDVFYNDLKGIYSYGLLTFGEIQAEKYEERIYLLTDALSFLYDMYPECRHIATKSRMYRNIILESHLIIYRIQTDRVEVLRVLHSHSSISKIKGSRSIKL